MGPFGQIETFPAWRALADFLTLILPIFLLIGIGLLAVRTGVALAIHIEGMASFVLNFALPALMFNALLHQDVHHSVGIRFFLAYGLGSLVSFIAIVTVWRLVSRRSLAHSAIAGLGAACSNTGFIGFPVASLVFGAAALGALAPIMLVENLLIIPLGLALAELGMGGKGSVWRSLAVAGRRLALMPLIWAIVLGGALAYFGVGLPAGVATAVEMLAKASAPCALFVVGGVVAGLAPGSVAADIGWIVVGKLILHPLAVTATFLLVGGVPQELFAVGVLIASVPMLTVYPIFGRRFGMDGLCAAALMATTIAGMLTLAIVLAILPGR